MVLLRMPLCIRYFCIRGRVSSGWISSSEIAGPKVKGKCVLSASAQFPSRGWYGFTPVDPVG